jgi:hypothetical protein
MNSQFAQQFVFYVGKRNRCCFQSALQSIYPKSIRMAGPGGSCLNPFEGSNLVFHLRGMHMDNYMELSLARPLEFELVFLYLPMGMMFRLKKQKASALSPTAATFFYKSF